MAQCVFESVEPASAEGQVQAALPVTARRPAPGRKTMAFSSQPAVDPGRSRSVPGGVAAHQVCRPGRRFRGEKRLPVALWGGCRQPSRTAKFVRPASGDRAKRQSIQDLGQSGGAIRRPEPSQMNREHSGRTPLS